MLGALVALLGRLFVVRGSVLGGFGWEVTTRACLGMIPERYLQEETMSIFERQELPLASAPLYYQALADLVEHHVKRLSGRIAATDEDARAYLNLFRGEAAAFQSAVIAHIDQRSKSAAATQEKKSAMKDGAGWIGLIREAVMNVARRKLPKGKERDNLKDIFHIGREFLRSSAGAVLVEVRYLSVVAAEKKTLLSPPLHADELLRGNDIAAAIEQAVFGQVNATAAQANASIIKSSAWDVLENKSKNLLELARLEFSKEEEHPDYAIRIAFEGLDEKFAPKPRAAPEEKPAL